MENQAGFHLKKLLFPQTVCPHYGVLTVGLGVVSFEVSLDARGFVCAGSHRVPFASTVCGRSSGAGFWVILPGVRVRFEAKHGFTWQVQEIGWFWRIEAWVYAAGARNLTLCENRGRRSILWTLAKRWQVCVCVCHSKDCVLRDRRRESASWMLCFEAEGVVSWEGLHFWNLNLRISLRGQCSISYDLRSWFRGRRSTSETCFHFRGSLAENARFGAPDLQFSRKSRAKRSFWK